jgi:ribonuclease T1
VKTPGAKDRGARRIVAGVPGEYYYTDDHYKTFRRIIE